MGNTDKNSALGVLAKVPETLRSLVEENAKLASELEGFRRTALAEDIVSTMEEKGLDDSDLSFREKVAALLSSDNDLELIKKAVELSPPNLSFATLTENKEEGHDNSFEDYILGASI